MTEVFKVETDSSGTPIRYSCEELMEYNEATQIKVEYFYDLMYPDSLSLGEAKALGEAALLDAVATDFGLIDGARCSMPPVETLWLTEVTSNAEDEFIESFSSCQQLIPAIGQNCSVFEGFMEAYYFGDGDPEEFQRWIQDNLDTGNTIGVSDGLEILYLGAQLDISALSESSAKDNLAPASNTQETPPSPIQQRSKKVTFVGGLMVAGFLAAFIALFFVLYKRRKRFMAAQEVEIALSKSDLDGMETDHGMDPAIEIGEEEDGVEEDFPTSYRFDMAANMKNELFHIHGKAPNTTPAKAYGIGIEETSDSDADSWAQTDGTIGSLELQLEPITAEV